ncbi:MAG: hypothetical protein R2855_10705 [Thermomicrobiales bacterium]
MAVWLPRARLTLLDLYSHHEHLLRVFFIALFFSTILTGLTTLILRWLDRRDPLPWQLYASLLAWGQSSAPDWRCLRISESSEMSIGGSRKTT